MNSNKVKFAFTMAEVLITLVIIGIVAAFLLKAVSRINPDKDRVMFLRAFHAIENAAAEVANDLSYYDSDSIEGADLSSTPLPNARVKVQIGSSTVTLCPSTSPYSDCSKKLTNKTAPCYFISERLNVVGDVSCESSSTAETKNFQMGNGACVYGLAGRSGSYDFVISPSCEGVSKGYAVTLYSSGNITVPQSSSTYKDKFAKKEIQQKKAYQWMKEQTDVKQKKYDFEKTTK